MKRILLLSLFTLMLSFFPAQNLKPVAEKVQNYQKTGKVFPKYEPFTQDLSVAKKQLYEQAARDITVMQLKRSEIARIVADKPESMELSFPFEGNIMSVLLVKNNIFTHDFAVNTDKGKTDYRPGVYYQGIVKGDEKSLVAFSFFDNDVVGVSSVDGIGNIVLGKAKGSEDFVSYSDFKMTGKNPFVCGFDEIEENQRHKVSFDPKQPSAKITANCVRIYYEACYAPYQNNGSDVTATVNWVTAVHNNIGTLYSNDDVKTAVSEVFVWTSPDPYTGTYNQNLAAFRANRQVFNGDLAHLVNSPSTTSVAYLNSLCGTSRYAYSGINQTYNNVPTYSWTIMAMTHEMGHSMGSPHTHACVWNGDDTPIDGCGAAAGYSEGCEGPIPTAGTIMSYCHLIGGVGISFNNGFGEQPGALIRNTVESKPCLGTDCTESCPVTMTAFTYSDLTSSSVKLSITDNVSQSWKYRITDYSGTIIASGVTAEKTFTVNGLSEGTYYRIMAGTDCSGPEAFQKELVVLTDADWCSGVVFTDTGGTSGNYQNNQTIVKTFYPSSSCSSAKLKLVFTEFALEQGYDFMGIFNGPSTSSPIFPGAGNLTGSNIPGPFTGTSESGAITVRFTSDSMVTDAGWEAHFEGIFLATDEADAKSGVQISPNPTKGMITIKVPGKILSYEIADLSGKVVAKYKKDTRTDHQEADLSRLPAGTYLVTVQTDKDIVTKKVVKY